MVTVATGVSASATDTIPDRPSLVVGITIDGLSYNYLELLRHRFGTDGFNRLINDGVTFTDIDFGTPLDAAAAAAVIYTGAAPTINGVASATIYDATARRLLPLLNSDSPSAADENYSPSKLLASTIADELKIDGGGLGQVHAVAPDASMAVITAGHAANSSYWINDISGKWTTSTYFPDRPSFIQYRNKMMPLQYKLDTLVWAPMMEISLYPNLPSFRRTYPFSIRFARSDSQRYYRYKSTPMVNTETTDVAIEYLRSVETGKHESPDMLSISYTLQPYPYGKDSDDKLENMDGYLRLDRELARLFEAVNEGPGLDRTLFFIAGTPVKPRSRRDDEKWRIPGGDFHPKRAISLLNLYLINKFGNGEWVSGYNDGYFYINPSTIADHGAEVVTVRNEAAGFLRKMAGVAYAYTIDDIAARRLHDNAHETARNTRADASGDILITVAPGWHIVDDDEAMVSTSLPLVERSASSTAPAFILAPGVEPKVFNEVIDARILAPTIAGLLRIRSPNGASLAPMRL